MRLLSLLCLFAVASCSTQAIIRTDGTKLVNNNFLSAGTMQVMPDNSILMTGTAEEAAKQLARYGGVLINAGLVKHGLNAAQSVGNTALKK